MNKNTQLELDRLSKLDISGVYEKYSTEYWKVFNKQIQIKKDINDKLKWKDVAIKHNLLKTNYKMKVVHMTKNEILQYIEQLEKVRLLIRDRMEYLMYFKNTGKLLE